MVPLFRERGHLSYKTTVCCYCTHSIATNSNTVKALIDHLDPCLTLTNK